MMAALVVMEGLFTVLQIAKTIHDRNPDWYEAIIQGRADEIPWDRALLPPLEPQRAVAPLMLQTIQTMPQTTLRQKQSKFLCMVAHLILWAAQHGYELTGGELERTKAQQALYLQQGKSQTKHSKHLTRLAIDLHLFIEGVYQQSYAAYEPLGQYWESLDPKNVWGGRWTTLRDCVHFEFNG